MPQTLTEVRNFPGLASYYQRLVQKISKIITHLTKKISKNEKFEWIDKCEKSSQELKKRQVLVLPNKWENFMIHSDVFRKGLECVLMQYDRVNTYAYNWNFTSKISNSWFRIGGNCVCIEDLKILLVWRKQWDLHGSEEFKIYRHFKETQHAARRWLELIKYYDYTIDYHQAKANVGVDALRNIIVRLTII